MGAWTETLLAAILNHFVPIESYSSACMVFICPLSVQDSMYLLFVSLREVHRCHPGGLSMCARPTPSFSPWAAAFEISEFYRAAEAPLFCRLRHSPQERSTTGRSSMFIWRGWGARQVRCKPQEWWVGRYAPWWTGERSWGRRESSPSAEDIHKWWINTQVLNEFSFLPSLFSLSLLFILLSFTSFFFFKFPHPIGVCGYFGENIVHHKAPAKLEPEYSSLCEPLRQPSLPTVRFRWEESSEALLIPLFYWGDGNFKCKFWIRRRFKSLRAQCGGECWMGF